MRKMQPKRPVEDPLAQAAPPRKVPKAKQQQAFDDDILIPPPREAKAWYCAECGQTGAVPDPGYLDIDPRYSVGTCECQPNRKGGRPRVRLIADFHFDRAEWERAQAPIREKKAYEKSVNGGKMSWEEVALANRFRLKVGLAPLDE
jgi:hypothetical protein